MSWGFSDPPMFGNMEARDQWERENPEEAGRISREIIAPTWGKPTDDFDTLIESARKYEATRGPPWRAEFAWETEARKRREMNLEAGPELDQRVAAAIGFVHTSHWWAPRSFNLDCEILTIQPLDGSDMVCLSRLPRFSVDTNAAIAACLAVEQYFAEDFRFVSIGMTKSKDGPCPCIVNLGESHGFGFGQTFAVALCAAILSIKGLENA